jgi:hypothetical protein
MPWRYPITAISSVVEDGFTLDAGAYELRGSMLDRLDAGASRRWAAAEIVVDFTAGWDLEDDDARPADLEAVIIDQVRTMYQGRSRDPALRSEATESVGSASYSVAGGDSIGRSGLLVSVEALLDDLRAVPV